MDCSMTGFPVHHQLPNLLKLMSIESVIPSNHLIHCHPFSSCLQSFPASGFFLMSWLFTPDGQSIGVSALASVCPMNIQDWFPLGLTGWIYIQSKGLSRVFSNTTVQKHQFFRSKTPSYHHNNLVWIHSCPRMVLYTHTTQDTQEIQVQSLGWENNLEEGMATHTSVLAWRIPGMGEPGGLLSMGSHRVGHDGSDLAAAAAYICVCMHLCMLSCSSLVQLCAPL